MARVELAPAVLDDFDRFLDHMARFAVEVFRDPSPTLAKGHFRGRAWLAPV
jgi:hypothetical protein